mmetsp:Transcript_12178/g.34870  ORF Transcript_12178/g.34870 Transcript_12178/m.34870 type:complete len:113 (+) Transcript_12178:738-1076(+)
MDGGAGIDSSLLFVAVASPSSSAANDVTVREESDREMPSAPCCSSLLLLVLLPAGECLGETCTVCLGDTWWDAAAVAAVVGMVAVVGPRLGGGDEAVVARRRCGDAVLPPSP